MNKITVRLNDTLQSIKGTLSLSDEQFSELLGETPAVYKKIVEGRSRYTIRHLDSLSQSLGLNFSLLFSGKIDYRALYSKYHGHALTLPERYDDPSHKLARTRALKSMLHFIGLDSSYRRAARILSKLQVTPAHLGDPDEFISARLTADFLGKLRPEQFSDEQIRSMGSMTLAIAQDTPAGLALSAYATPKDVYRAIHEELRHLADRLWEYRLMSLTDTGCVVHITPQEQTLETFKDDPLGNRELCLFLQGVYSSFLLAVRPSELAKVFETECMYQGGRRCIYHVFWNREHSI